MINRKCGKLVGMALLLGILLFHGYSAATPPGFYRMRSQLSTGIGSRVFLGDLGDYADAGLSFWLAEQIEYGWFGFRLRLGTSYYLTHQEAPPFDKGLQSYTVGAGPRFIAPIVADFSLVFNVEYELLGFISNSLVQQTGSATIDHGLCGGMGVRYVFSVISVEAEVHFDFFFGLDEPVLTTFLTVGFLNTI